MSVTRERRKAIPGVRLLQLPDAKPGRDDDAHGRDARRTRHNPFGVCAHEDVSLVDLLGTARTGHHILRSLASLLA
jgi:hypothetical protein